MRILNDTDLLRLWESGLRRHPLDRALLVLAEAYPDTTYEHLADWPIGRRNQALTRLRCQCFGPSLHARTTCANCREKLEFELNGAVLAGEEIEWDKIMDRPVIVKGLAFRVPTSRDLAHAARETDAAKGAIRIANSCLVEGNPPSSWSEDEVALIGDSLASADPLAEINLAMNCPGCGLSWQGTLDVFSFFWDEIEARARQMLAAVHILASAYGWSEADIFSLSAGRRSFYLEQVAS